MSTSQRFTKRPFIIDEAPQGAEPPEGILSRFNDMFDEKEKATHIKAAEVMRELGWNATDWGELLQSIPVYNALLKSLHIQRIKSS